MSKESDQDKKIRTFIAIDIPEEIKNEISKIKQLLISKGVEAKWTAPENIHLTMVFIGELPVSMVDSYSNAISETVKSFSKISLNIEGIGAFPGLKSPKVIWARVTGDVNSLINVHNELNHNLKSIGFKPETRRFKAHITFGRISKQGMGEKMVNAVRDIGIIKPQEFEACGLTFYKSTLTSKGAEYSVLFKDYFRP